MELRFELKDIDAVAEQVLKALHTKVILLIGEMGVGKTTFVKSFVKALGSTDTVTSPTFSIVNEYELERDLIYHFDLYRINDEEEALQFGIEDYLSSNKWIVLEWPEKISNLLPSNIAIVELILNKDLTRTLKMNKTNI